MKTIAPEAPTSHTSARCKASTPGAALTDGSELPAVDAYAITHSSNYATQPVIRRVFGPGSVSVFVLRNQRQRRLEKNVEVEQHRPVLDVIKIELDALLDFFFAVDFPAPAVDLGPAGDPRSEE